jgi:hypothetical protein
MLIFDGFKDKKAAENVGVLVATAYSLKCEAFDSQKESQKVDPFPWKLRGAVLLVQRSSFDKIEECVIRLVRRHGAFWAGT